MIWLAALIFLILIGGALGVLIACNSDKRSAVEHAFDDALAQGELPEPEELFEAFSVAADGSSEEELTRLAGQLSNFNRRLKAMTRQNAKEK